MSETDGVKFTILQRGAPGKERSVNVMAPVLPRAGEHVSHDKSGISGYVNDVMFWWDEKGNLRQIQVALK